VFGFVPHANPAVHDGAWAELITLGQDTSIAKRPAAVDVATAGAAPLAGITAMTSIDALELSAGDTVNALRPAVISARPWRSRSSWAKSGRPARDRERSAP
jgi:hypothetical protein